MDIELFNRTHDADPEIYEHLAKVENNLLFQEKFDELQTLIMSENFPWYYTDGIDFASKDSDGKSVYLKKEDKNKFMFTHMFFHFR